MASLTGGAAGRRGRRPEVLPLALGCMGMSRTYGAADDAESIATIYAALDRGVDGRPLKSQDAQSRLRRPPRQTGPARADPC